MKKKDEKGMMEEMQQHKVAQMINSAEGSAGLLHRTSKPTAWWRGVQILVNEEEDAMMLDRCAAKKERMGKNIGNEMRWCRTWRKSLGRTRN